MAQNKRQHFVPQFYLRHFASDVAKKQICLYNLASDVLVTGAPIRNQCTKNFIYAPSNDLRLEGYLSEIEQLYGAVSSKINGSNRDINSDDVELLRFFVGLQYFRTDSSMVGMKHMYNDLMFYTYEEQGFKIPNDDMTDRKWMLESLKAFLELRYILVDLKSCILINNSNTRFIASDNPAVMFNRFLCAERPNISFGLGGAGVVLFLPLSPYVAILFYDGDVYALEKEGKYIKVIKSAREVESLNDLQVINFSKNIYSSDKATMENVKLRVGGLRRFRLTDKHTLFTGVAQEKTAKGTKYVKASKEERLQANTMIVGVSNLHPIPPRWPHFLKNRHKPNFFDDGSASGPVRKATLDFRNECR